MEAKLRLLFSLCIKRPKLLLPDIPDSIMSEKIADTFLSLINRFVQNQVLNIITTLQ